MSQPAPRKTTILAHRANLTGPRSVPENSLEACAVALRDGFGLEIDLRRDAAGKYYISHDPARRTAENALEAFSDIFRQFPTAEYAVNVKELGYETELVRLMNHGLLGVHCFYFDFELLQPQTPGAAQRLIKSLPGGKTVLLAARLSDRSEPLPQCLAIPAEVVWANECDSLWMTGAVIRRLHADARQVYMVSPELHGFDHDVMVRRWADFKAWGIDGLCTDYPLEARSFFLV